jgi:hypothetical protein
LSRDKDIFFEKKKIRLFSTTYRRINAVNSKGEFLKILKNHFLEKILKKIPEKNPEKDPEKSGLFFLK